MKKILGILMLLIILAAAVSGALAIWDIYPIEWDTIRRILITLGIAFVAVSLLMMFGSFFFRKNEYEKGSGKAHKMK